MSCIISLKSPDRRVTIFVSKAVNYKVIDKFTDENGRIVLLNVHIDDAVFSLVCIYAPNSKTLRNMKPIILFAFEVMLLI
jgi:hypothetical protein